MEQDQQQQVHKQKAIINDSINDQQKRHGSNKQLDHQLNNYKNLENDISYPHDLDLQESYNSNHKLLNNDQQQQKDNINIKLTNLQEKNKVISHSREDQKMVTGFKLDFTNANLSHQQDDHLHNNQNNLSISHFDNDNIGQIKSMRMDSQSEEQQSLNDIGKHSRRSKKKNSSQSISSLGTSHRQYQPNHLQATLEPLSSNSKKSNISGGAGDSLRRRSHQQYQQNIDHQVEDIDFSDEIDHSQRELLDMNEDMDVNNDFYLKRKKDNSVSQRSSKEKLVHQESLRSQQKRRSEQIYSSQQLGLRKQKTAKMKKHKHTGNVVQVQPGQDDDVKYGLDFLESPELVDRRRSEAIPGMKNNLRNRKDLKEVNSQLDNGKNTLPAYQKDYSNYSTTQASSKQGITEVRINIRDDYNKGLFSPVNLRDIDFLKTPSSSQHRNQRDYFQNNLVMINTKNHEKQLQDQQELQQQNDKEKTKNPIDLIPEFQFHQMSQGKDSSKSQEKEEGKVGTKFSLKQFFQKIRLLKQNEKLIDKSNSSVSQSPVQNANGFQAQQLNLKVEQLASEKGTPTPGLQDSNKSSSDKIRLPILPEDNNNNTLSPPKSINQLSDKLMAGSQKNLENQQNNIMIGSPQSSKRNKNLMRDKELKKHKGSDIFLKSDFFTYDFGNFAPRKRTYRKYYKKFMIYPEDKWKGRWDLYITLQVLQYVVYIIVYRMLLYTCCQSPYSLAFISYDSTTWIIVNSFVDLCFMIDISINFFAAYYDSEFELIDDRKTVAKAYLQSWFTVDFLSIIPFDQIFENGSYNRLARIAKIGKMYKIIKMTRLVRMLKIVKERNKLVKYLNEILKIGIGFERLLFLLMIFLVMCHIVACLWVFTARFDEANKLNWIFQNDYQDYDDFTLYVTSFYFTVTTIVTVGYGDIHAYNTGERFISILLMLIGVISFSFATGALSSIISNYDAQQAKLKEKMATLNDIKRQYDLGQELFDELRKTIKYDHSKNYHDVIQFMDELPYKLKIELAMEIHKDIYRDIEFFKYQEKNFIVWVGPLLKPYQVSEQEYIYKEGDDIKESKSNQVQMNFYSIVYFLVAGMAGYVLPRFDNTVYIQIDKGDHFGIIDLVFDTEILNIKTNMRRRTQKSKDLYRRFYVQALINCELLLLSLEDIDKMKVEYPDVFDQLFTNSYRRLKIELQLKIDAIQYCEKANKISNLTSFRQTTILTSMNSSNDSAFNNKSKYRSSRFVQDYKEKKLKRHLTISDVKEVQNFSLNSLSLKQIDEELERSSSNDEDEEDKKSDDQGTDKDQGTSNTDSDHNQTDESNSDEEGDDSDKSESDHNHDQNFPQNPVKIDISQADKQPSDLTHQDKGDSDFEREEVKIQIIVENNQSNSFDQKREQKHSQWPSNASVNSAIASYENSVISPSLNASLQNTLTENKKIGHQDHRRLSIKGSIEVNNIDQKREKYKHTTAKSMNNVFGLTKNFGGGLSFEANENDNSKLLGIQDSKQTKPSLEKLRRKSRLLLDGDINLEAALQLNRPEQEKVHARENDDTADQDRRRMTMNAKEKDFIKKFKKKFGFFFKKNYQDSDNEGEEESEDSDFQSKHHKYSKKIKKSHSRKDSKLSVKQHQEVVQHQQQLSDRISNLENMFGRILQKVDKISRDVETIKNVKQ